MDLSQPVIVVLAFVAGFGVMLCTRMLWSLLTYSIYFIVLAAALVVLGQNGVIHLEELKNSAAGRFVQAGAEQLVVAGSGMKHWISDHEIKVQIAKKQSAEK